MTPPRSAPIVDIPATLSRMVSAPRQAIARLADGEGTSLVEILTQHRGGHGRPLVLLHGLGLTWRSWKPVLGALEARHDAIALDLPGFGASAPLERGVRPTPRALADAVAAELDRLGLEAPIVVGNSLGGWLALELARRGRAQRVVAIAPSGLETPPERAYVIGLNEIMRVRARAGAPFGRAVTVPRPTRALLFAASGHGPGESIRTTGDESWMPSGARPASSPRCAGRSGPLCRRVSQRSASPCGSRSARWTSCWAP
jgi:pimeloyl-ACP methyl ester carboxylesterase